MSPEQARGSRNLDQSTDLWSLAIIAFECLTGQQPFAGKSIGDLVVQISTEEPCLPSRLIDAPRGFDAWFLKGVSKDPAERFGSAREMAASLREVLARADAPVTQSMGWSPPTPPETGHLAFGLGGAADAQAGAALAVADAAACEVSRDGAGLESVPLRTPLRIPGAAQARFRRRRWPGCGRWRPGRH